VAGNEPLVNEIFIDAAPELVFSFLTDGELMKRWMGVSTEIDPRPGGIYRVGFGAQAARGEYVAVVPARKVAFTWGYESGMQGMAPGSSLVEITLEPRPPGTLVRLVHNGLPSDEATREHDEGWRHYLARLKTVSEGGEPGPDRFIED
jgi:uncharacterized protein YndB with AHSA1/START domain